MLEECLIVLYDQENKLQIVLKLIFLVILNILLVSDSVISILKIF